MNIIPVNRCGDCAQGKISGYTVAEIDKILGFESNCQDDPDKVKHSWGFTVDGTRCGIWDYKGSHHYNVFSWFGPSDILNKLFPEK